MTAALLPPDSSPPCRNLSSMFLRSPVDFLVTLFAVSQAIPLYGQEKPPFKTAPLPSDHAQRLERGAQLFDAKVSAVLKENCLNCHGGEKTRSGFDLATREAMLQGGDKGQAVVPFSPPDSRLLRLVRHAEEPFMPGKSKKLAPDAIEALEQWVLLGAPFSKPLVDQKGTSASKKMTVTEKDRDFWSFRPLQPVPVPGSSDPWVRNPIDAFVLAKLKEKGIAPNPPASRAVLARRLSLILTGLPPEPARLKALNADPDALALDRYADELLASLPHAERWARHWLDIARFAESHGYEQDYDRPHAYPYRDWAIQALNRDLPYDRFVQWQIAGDELAPGDTFAFLATGFLGAGVHATQITKNQVEKERYDELDDIIRTIGAGMLGLSINCARCHDHKYDPVPAADYYRLISTFTKTVRSDMELPVEDPEYPQRLAAWEQSQKALAAKLASFDQAQGPQAISQWLAASKKNSAPTTGWEILIPEKAASEGGATLTIDPNGKVRSTGKNPGEDAYTVKAQTSVDQVRQIRIEAFADKTLVAGGSGRAANGNFALSNLTVTAFPVKPNPAALYKPVLLKLTQPRATFEQGGLPLAAAIDGDRRSGWAVDPQFGKDHAGAFIVESAPNYPGGTRLEFVLEFRTNTSHTIGTFRLSASGDTPALPLNGPALPGEAKDLLLGKAVDDAGKAKVTKWLLAQNPERVKLSKEVEAYHKAKPTPKTIKALVCSEGVPAIRLHTQGGDYLEQTHFLNRGDPNQKGEIAKQGFLQVLVPAGKNETVWQKALPEGARTTGLRSNLARWLVDPAQGGGSLLARVIVNRLWHHHFGRGLVATVNDFGLQGDRPTHPELLDWLASELIQNGWSLRHIHRLIVSSATWRESSLTDAARMKIDPTNQMLWRFTPRRLEAEAVRDCLLAVSGRLDPTPFGAGSNDPHHRRRSIYFFVKRSQLPADMMVFDAPDTLQIAEARPVTTVAPQALRLLNGKLARDCAESLADRVAAEVKSPPAADQEPSPTWVNALYERAVGRAPTSSEMELALEFLREQGQALKREGVKDPVKQARTELAHAIIQLNEFLYID